MIKWNIYIGYDHISKYDSNLILIISVYRRETHDNVRQLMNCIEFDLLFISFRKMLDMFSYNISEDFWSTL